MELKLVMPRFIAASLTLALLVSCTTTSVAPTASVASTVAASPTPSGPVGKLTIATSSDIESLHPYLGANIVSISARMNMFDNLIERDYDGKIVPGLAESWTVSGQTVEFKLRKGVKFHNGEDFNADVVKFSFDTMKSDELKAPAASLFGAVTDFKVVDPYTVDMVLSRIDASLIDVLAKNLSMLPPSYYKSVGLQGFLAKPIG